MRCSLTRVVVIAGILLGIALSAEAVPYSDSIPLPSCGGYSPCVGGGCSFNKSKWNWNAQYHSSFGGDWNVTGFSRSFTGNQYRDTFSGTVSDTTINGTFTEADFDWASDGYLVCKSGQTEGDYLELAISFTIKISNGIVTGSASYPND